MLLSNALLPSSALTYFSVIFYAFLRWHYTYPSSEAVRFQQYELTLQYPCILGTSTIHEIDERVIESQLNVLAGCIGRRLPLRIDDCPAREYVDHSGGEYSQRSAHSGGHFAIDNAPRYLAAVARS